MLNPEKMNLYKQTADRLRRAGVTDPTSMIIYLEEEIRMYRRKIHHLERLLHGPQVGPIPEEQAPPKRFTHFDPIDGKLYAAQYYAGDQQNIATEYVHKGDPAGGVYLFRGPLIDRLGELEDQIEREYYSGTKEAKR